MKSAINDDYGKKFQLTDSLLKRLLSREDYDRIKTIEPVFVFTDESICKQLKSPGYKHAVISSNYLYIVNTPAKQDADLVFVVPLEDVEDIKLIYDTADFLQGDLRENAQHIRLSCKQHLATTESLLMRAASLALISTDSSKYVNENNKFQLSSSRSSSELPDDTPDSKESMFRNCKSLNTSPTSSFSKTKTELQQNGLTKKINSKEVDEKASSSISRRPLPKPLKGTEMLNASYTSSILMANLPARKKLKNKSPKVSPSRSLESLDFSTNHIPRLPLTKSQKSYLCSSSLNQSWNDILRAEQASTSSSSALKNPAIEVLIASEASSASLNGSLSSKVFRLIKGSKENLSEKEMSTSSFSSGDCKSRSRNMSTSESDVPKPSLEEYHVEVFTITPGSKVFNIIEQSWIYSVIAKTCGMNGTSESTIHHQRKAERDEVLQKFTQLKEEILSSSHDDELFLLTKEVKYASDHYLVIRKAVWKSPSLLIFYVGKLKSLVESRSTDISARMDELDVAIMVGEFLVSTFQDSELFTGRNMILNDHSGRFVKDILSVILSTPRMKCIHKAKFEGQTDELFELIGTWSDVCVSIMFEIINAAKQNVWCCSLEVKSLDVTMLSNHLSTEDKKLKNLIDQLVLKLTSQLTTEWAEKAPTPVGVVVMYKSLTVLHFICTHCPVIMDYVKTFYHEEVKYYISKEDNIKRIPPNYPVTCLIASFLPVVIESIT